VTQRFLIPTISLVFYYGFTNWSLKLRRVQVQNISESAIKGRWEQQKENTAHTGGTKNRSNTCSVSHFLKGKFLNTKFHIKLDIKFMWMKPSGKPRYGQSDNTKMDQAMRMWMGSSGSLYGTVVEFCEQGNEPLHCTKFLVSVAECQCTMELHW